MLKFDAEKCESIDSQSDLDNRIVSESLQHAFTENEYFLSSDIQVEIVQAGFKWIIYNGDDAYLVIKTEEGLNIYTETTVEDNFVIEQDGSIIFGYKISLDESEFKLLGTLHAQFSSGIWEDAPATGSRRTYQGCFQYEVAATEDWMNGKWLGYSTSQREIRTGDWEWHFVRKGVSQESVDEFKRMMRCNEGVVRPG